MVYFHVMLLISDQCLRTTAPVKAMCGLVIDDDDEREVVSLELWLSKPDVKYHFKCQHIRENNDLAPRYVVPFCYAGKVGTLQV